MLVFSGANESLLVVEGELLRVEILSAFHFQMAYL